MDVPEIDPNFEPQSRARSNTWPLRPKETIKDEEASRSPTIDEHCVENNNKDPLGLTGGKKSGSRRNAWGNLSYADLITKAIQGTPEKRLTLSQIYDWMVQNVPYFKDKGDSNSSAGWKVGFENCHWIWSSDPLTSLCNQNNTMSYARGPSQKRPKRPKS